MRLPVMDAGLALPDAVVADTGLTLPEGLTFEQVRDVIVRLVRVEASIQFAIGDALLYSEERFGNKYTEIEAALAAAGVRRSRETLRAYAWCARRVPPVMRNTALSWWHHRQVAKLPPDEQRRWLQQAEDERWSVRELRYALRWPARIEEPAALEGGRYRLLHCNVDRLAELLPARSVDLIVTDPLYDREHLAMYSTLSKVAAHVVRPGGVVAALASVSFLPEVIERLGEHLTYYWMMSLNTAGGATPQPGSRPFFRRWKPLLVFVAGDACDYRGPWYTGDDDIRTDTPVRAVHPFEQSELGMRGLVERLSRPDEILLDPFCGSGTTGVAALTLGRRFIGADVDADAVAITAARLKAAS